jgi:hypothetical protein
MNLSCVQALYRGSSARVRDVFASIRPKPRCIVGAMLNSDRTFGRFSWPFSGGTWVVLEETGN